MAKQDDIPNDAIRMYELLVESAGEAICVIDADGVFRFLNRAAAEKLGGGSEGYVGKTCWDLFPKEIADRHIETIRKVIETGRGVAVQDSAERLQGQDRWYNTSIQPFTNGDGTTAALVIARDVTDRQQAQYEPQTALDELKKLESIVDRSPAIVFRWRLAEHFPVEFVSRNVAQLGYAPDDFTSGRVSWPGITHPDDETRLRKEVEQFLADRRSQFSQRYRIFTADGEVRWVEDSNRVIRDADGDVTHIEGVIWDVTERQRAEEAVRRSEEKYRSLFDAETDAIVILDAETLCFLDANASATRTYGYSRNELLGLTQRDITAEPAESRELIGQIAAGERTYVELTHHRRKDGNVFPVEISASTFTLDGRQVLCGIIRDITERVRAEEELRRSESMLAESQRIAGLGSWDWDIENDVLRWSSETYRIFGVDSASFTPTSSGFLAMVHPDDLDRVQTAIDRAMRERAPYDVEHRIIRPDGAERVIHEQGQFFFDEDGHAFRTIGTAFDVTDHRRAEQALRESEAKYRALAENVNDVVYSMDAQGHLTYVSPQIARYDLSPETVVGLHFQELIVPEDRQRVLDDFERSVATGAEFPTELRLRDAEGRIHWLEDQGKLLRDDAGRIVGVSGVLRDITDRKRLEEAYRSLVDYSLQGLSIVQDKRIVFVNPAFERITGYSTDELLSLDADGVLELIHPDDRETIFTRYRDRLAGRSVPPNYEYRLQRKDGEVRWVEVFVRRVDYQDRPASQVAYLDITDRKAAETHAERYRHRLRHLAMELSLAEEQQRRRLAGALHDELAQLLTLLKIRLSLLRDATEESDRLRGLEETERLVDRANRSARSLMSQLSHPALYDMGFVPAAEWLAEDICRLYGLDVAVEDDGEPKPIAEPIRVLLYQCLREVLTNVAKHAEVAGAYVSIRTTGQIAQVMVEDKGVGFDPSVVERDIRDGGFGLFSIRERLEPLGGRVEIRSAPGQGTTVLLEVPIEGQKEGVS